MIHTEIEDILKKKKKVKFYYPDYDTYSLSKVPAVVESLLTKNDDPIGFLDTAKQHLSNTRPQKVVLFLLDGFGYEQWKRHYAYYPFFKTVTEKGNVFPLTTIFPSSTPAALTSLSTGLTPQEHGLLEWWVYYEEINKTVLTLPFTPKGLTGNDRLREEGVDPHLLFNNQTVFQRLREHKVRSFVFTPYANTVYSSLAHAGAVTIPYHSVADLAVNLRQALEAHDEPGYFYVYFSGIDTSAHAYGPHTEQYLAEMSSFSHSMQTELIEKLPDVIKQETLLLVTSDHGQIVQPKERIINLRDFPDIMELLHHDEHDEPLLPWGSPRNVYVKAKYGSEGRLYTKLKKVLKGKADVMWSKDAMDTGVYGIGTPHSQWMKRLADITILAHDDYTIWAEPRIKIGGHGGLTKEEMWIPFGMLELTNT